MVQAMLSTGSAQLPASRHLAAQPVLRSAPRCTPCSGRSRTCLAASPAPVDTEEVRASEQLLNRAASSGNEKPEGFDARAFRRSLNRTGRYTRKPMNDKDSIALMDAHGVGYSLRGLVAQMKENGHVWQQGDVTVRLADAYGYCWGVERAVQMAYEARSSYPGQKLHITNEIIHNPSVNRRLQEMDIEIVADSQDGKDFSKVQKGDVVIFPAFGASVQEMQLLNDKEATMVDTTCPWVSKVWNAVDNQARKSHTSVIHGKWAHEETVATASFATTYLIVKDIAEAQFVCDYITGKRSDKDEFFAKFHLNAYSKGFDPERDLEHIGIANQTTMLKGDTQQIGKMLEKAMLEHVGPANLKGHFMIMDTICDATQERQDAVYDLVGKQEQPEAKLDILLVVGGFNSSNTSHLQEIGELKGVPSFWVNGADCIDPAANTIQHKTSWGELATTEGWLPEGPLTIGVTSGASTPDRSVEDVLDQVFRIKDPDYAGIALKELSKAELEQAAAENRPEEH